MCMPLEPLSLGLSIASAAAGGLQQVMALQQQKAMAEAQAQAAIKQMNYDMQDYETARAELFDETLSKLNYMAEEAASSQGAVTAALNEEMGAGGRTVDLIYMDTDREKDIAQESLKNAWGKQNSRINENKIRTYENTKDYINGIPVNSGAGTIAAATLGTLANITAQTVQYKNTQMNNKLNKSIMTKGGAVSYNLQNELANILKFGG